MENEKKFDSAPSTEAHIRTVQRIGDTVIKSLEDRFTWHDSSKTCDPEKACYDKYIPMLQKAKYGSKEYYDIKKEMEKDGLNHHFQVNRHHPEHFENGISGMTIVDLVEYFVDTYAASTRSDTQYSAGVKMNQEKHKLPDELVQIFMNTVEAYF